MGSRPGLQWLVRKECVTRRVQTQPDVGLSWNSWQRSLFVYLLAAVAKLVACKPSEDKVRLYHCLRLKTAQGHWEAQSWGVQRQMHCIAFEHLDPAKPEAHTWTVIQLYEAMCVCVWGLFLFCFFVPNGLQVLATEKNFLASYNTNFCFVENENDNWMLLKPQTIVFLSLHLLLWHVTSGYKNVFEINTF